jgi:hypothetical protein
MLKFEMKFFILMKNEFYQMMHLMDQLHEQVLVNF